MSKPSGRLLITALLLSSLAYSQVGAASRAAEVRVAGTHRVEAGAVRAQITIQPGEEIDYDAIDSDVRAIYELGLFENVWVTELSAESGTILTYHVKEHPYVAEIVFEGVDEVSEEDLAAEVKIRERAIYDPRKAWEGLRDAHKLYASEGYPDTTIEIELRPIGDQEVKVVYAVNEGELVRVDKIKFEGVKAFDHDRLRKVMATKERWWFSWLTGAGLLNEDEIASDVERLTAFYYDNGYIQVRIDEPVIERGDDGLIIRMKIDEGPHYSVGDVSFAGDLLMTDDELRFFSRVKTGDGFKASALREAIFSLVEGYGNLGHAFAEVVPQTSINESDRLVDIVFEISSGPSVTVRRVEIRGNTKTRDHVIRRELQIHEGQTFSGEGLRRSREAIRRLGFFDEVELTTNRTEVEDQLDLLVQVKEGRTGTFSAGAGFSSGDNFVFNARVSEQNLFGRAQRAVLNADFGSTRQNFQLSFTEPWFGGRPLSLGGDLFNWKLEFDDFDRGGTGFAIRSSYPLRDLGYESFLGLSLARVRIGLEYRLEQAEIDAVAGDAPPEIKIEEGTSLTSSISPRLIRSTLDHPFDPARGSRQVLSAEFAGLGGESDFIKLEASGRWYWPVFRTKGGRIFVYSLGTTLGYGIGDSGTSGEELPLFERYFPGGINSHRGFETRTLGPTGVTIDDGEIINEEEIGGSSQLIFNNDFLIPIIPDAGFKGVLFFDAGNAFTAEDGLDVGDLRYAVGWGIRWLSPLGPLRVEIGYPLDPEDDEDSSVVQFSFGAPF